MSVEELEDAAFAGFVADLGDPFDAIGSSSEGPAMAFRDRAPLDHSHAPCRDLGANRLSHDVSLSADLPAPRLRGSSLGASAVKQREGHMDAEDAPDVAADGVRRLGPRNDLRLGNRTPGRRLLRESGSL